MDYFVARYYSAPHGRFLSPDEFSGGPTELFAAVAAHNPTFYADLASPQTLNKYQYTLGNPLRFIDPDGHQEAISDAIASAVNDPVGTAKAAGTFVKDYWKGEVKAIGNIGIGANNLGAIALRRPDAMIQAFDVNSSDAEFLGHKAMSMLTLMAPALSEAGPLGVFTAEAKQTTVTAVETANAVERTTTLKPGPFATESIPARGPGRQWNASEQAFRQGPGQCHICGTKDPGTKSGNWVLDHQPVSALNSANAPQRLFRSCLPCSQRQGGEVRTTLQQLGQATWADRGVR